MNTLIFLVVVFFIIYAIAQGRGGTDRRHETSEEKGQSFDPSNYETRPTMMNPSERLFFETLRRAIGDKFDIYPQVNLDKIFKTKYQNNKYSFNGAKWAIDRRSVDYLLVKRDTQSPKVAIELDGSSHERQDRIERDEKVASIFEYNGIPLVRFNTSDNFSADELRAKFERYF